MMLQSSHIISLLGSSIFGEPCGFGFEPGMYSGDVEM